MSESLKNKISLVTGASRGIGAAIAIELAKCGASVIGTATSEKGAEIIKKSFEINKVKGQAMVLDVNSNASIETLMDKINEEFGTVDILINNAGITHSRYPIDENERRRLGCSYKYKFKICIQAKSGSFKRHDEESFRPYYKYFISGWPYG